MNKDTLIAHIKDIENELHNISDDADIPSSIRIDLWGKLSELHSVIDRAGQESRTVEMKYIKTTDGWYIDREKIDSFTVSKYFGTDGKGAGYAAYAYNYGQRWRLKEFVIKADETEAKIQAEAWLDKFVSELNEEAKQCGKL